MNNIANPLTFNHRAPRLQNDDRKQRNYQNLRPAYEAMNWKNYTMTRPRNISLEDADRLSNKTSARQHQPTLYYQPQHYQPMNGMSNISQKKLRQQNLRLSGVTYTSKRQQHATRVKQDAIRRVKMLQQKVLPLISNQKNSTQQQNEEYGFAWQLKMQQRLVKIQNSIQKVKNQIEIKYQKRLMEIERQWEERIGDLLEMVANGQQRNNSNGVEGNETDEKTNQVNGINHMNETNRQSRSNNYEPVVNGKSHYNYYLSGFEDQQGQVNGVEHNM